MDLYQLGRKLRRFAEAAMVRVAPLTHIVPERFRHRLRDGILRVSGISKGREPRRLPAPWQPGQDPAGINLYGFFKASNGLAQGVRLYAGAIDQAGIPLSCLNTDFLYWLPQNDTSWDSRLTQQAPYAINVVHINPDQWVEATNCYPISFFDGRYTIGVWLWELEDIPAAWSASLPYVRELWAPSRFIADALRKVTDIPVTVIPYGVEAPQDERLNRADFGLPEDAFLVLVMYDANSYASRKNPEGAIEAFLRAFGTHPDRARLVIKINHPQKADLRRIERLLGKDGPYILIRETMDKPRLNRLIALCDVYLSLHRSEGFGLVMAEAMLLGVPTVATGWSANTEFMPEDCACLVGCSLVPVGEAYQYAAPGQRWADPDLYRAADALRRLMDDPEAARAMAARGQRYIREHLSPEVCARRIRERFDTILQEGG
ncbi:MAG: glycosyltransferase family 4 protein [Clostridia bacterium]|nr:glycosyltransferase family 4 protein [Clostridia bacterium]